MASKVPKFGAWEGGENFTVFFDNARKMKINGSTINPNDPEQNPNMFQQKNGAPIQAPPSHKKVESQGKQSKVPQFGAWDNGGNVGYTVCFENARKTRTDGPTNLETEPQINRDMHPPKNPSTQTRPAKIKPEPQDPRTKVPEFGAWEGGGDLQYTVCFDNVRKKNGSVSSEEPSNGTELNWDVTHQNEPLVREPIAKVPQFGAWDGRENVAYTTFFDNARKNKANPIEPQLNRDVGERARPVHNGATKTREGGHVKNASRRSTASTAGSETNNRHGRQGLGGQLQFHLKGGRPQPKSGNRGSQNPEKGATIPPFGVWNNNPAQAEDFTGTFKRAREDKMTPLNKNTPASRYQQTQQSKHKTKKGCCFPWFG